MININQNYISGIQKALDNLYSTNFGINLNDSKSVLYNAMKAQRMAYEAFNPSISYAERAIKSMQPISNAADMLRFNSSEFQISTASQQLEQFTQKWRDLLYPEVSQSANIGEKLFESMKPFLDSNDLKLKATVNSIFNDVTDNPANAFNSFQKAIQAPIAPTFNHPNHTFGEESQTIENDNQIGDSKTETDDSFNAAKNVIKEYTDSVKKDYAKSYDSERVIKFFVDLMQFVAFISFIIGINGDTETSIEISEALCGCIKWAINYDKRHRID